MTHYTLADLDMADRHIAEGEGHIARQEVLMMGLRIHAALPKGNIAHVSALGAESPRLCARALP